MAQRIPSHLLLTIPGCCVECAGIEYRGTLVLEYIAVAPTGQLVLRVGAFETLVPRTQPVVHQRARGVYEIPGTPAPATLRVPLVAPNAAARVILDAFDVLLARHAVVRDADRGPRAAGRADVPNMDGRVVVVALPGSVAPQEDARGRKKPGILADPPPLPELYVRALLPEETAALLRTAHALSRGIVLATTTLAAGMACASSTFVARTAPSPTPVVFSAAARRAIALFSKGENLQAWQTSVPSEMTRPSPHTTFRRGGGSRSRLPPVFAARELGLLGQRQRPLSRHLVPPVPARVPHLLVGVRQRPGLRVGYASRVA